MIVGVPREIYPGERRVSLVPAVVPSLMKAGLEVVLEAGAGKEAGYLDREYTEKGARVFPSRQDVFSTADMVVQVLCHGSNDKTGTEDVALLRHDQVLIGFLRPLGSQETKRSSLPRIRCRVSFPCSPPPQERSCQGVSSLLGQGWRDCKPSPRRED